MPAGEKIDYIRTGPGSPVGRIIRRFWQPIALAEEVRAARPLRVEVLGEHLTFYRGDSGRPYLVADRCPHRGTQLSLGWVERECVRCFYHGWKFDGAGNCVEQPAEKGSFSSKVKIKSYAVEEYLGLIFAYLGNGPAPELPRFPELEDESFGILSARKVRVPCNYFQRIENDLDEVHIHYAHKPATVAAGLKVMPELFVEERPYGLYRKSVRRQDGQEIVRDGATC